jgi:phospholipase/lecithinase/hemolysin
MNLNAVLVIAGIVFMAAGLLFLVFAKRPAQSLAVAQSAITDVAELIKQIGEFLDKFEERFRIGLAVMFFGLALVGAGVYLEANAAKDSAKDAKDAAKAAPATTPAP